MTASVIRAHAANLPLPDASVDLIVTSPPYFGLRSYTDGGAHYAGQIGSEGTPGEWLEALWACTAEWVRVLKPEGSLFVNLGDKYSGDATPGGVESSGLAKQRGGSNPQVTAIRQPRRKPSGRPKSLLGLPWRYAIGCTDRLGLILRAEVIWVKPNGLPESVTDRVRRAHEQVFHFTRLPRYYAAVDEIREPHTWGRTINDAWTATRRAREAGAQPNPRGGEFASVNPLGKLPGSVWDIPSQPLQVPAELGVDHFAAFPMELPRRIILGWSPPGVCTACHQGRRPVTSASYVEQDRLPDRRANGTGNWLMNTRAYGRASRETAITGYACGCPEPSAPTRPAVVLDPFGGTGTTALVASVLGRHGITADLSADYCRLAAWRTSDPGERARAMQVPKPPPVMDGQEALFA